MIELPFTFPSWWLLSISESDFHNSLAIMLSSILHGIWVSEMGRSCGTAIARFQRSGTTPSVMELYKMSQRRVASSVAIFLINLGGISSGREDLPFAIRFRFWYNSHSFIITWRGEVCLLMFEKWLVMRLAAFSYALAISLIWSDVTAVFLVTDYALSIVVPWIRVGFNYINADLISCLTVFY